MSDNIRSPDNLCTNKKSLSKDNKFDFGGINNELNFKGHICLASKNKLFCENL